MSKQSDAKWDALYKEAMIAGEEAVSNFKPTPMIVEQHVDMLNDSSPVTRSWYVEAGVCGFAWVNVRPGTCSFAKWLRKNDIGHSSYYGGWDIWISQYNQSMQRKEVHAAAMADFLQKNGITAHARSRMD